MGQPLTIPPGFEKLPVREQLEYVQTLWKRIGEGQAEIPSPEWHAEVVEKRLADYRADPASATAWEDLRGELVTRFDRPR
jgi:putative addiction module component (TIGR02574 family)